MCSGCADLSDLALSRAGVPTRNTLRAAQCQLRSVQGQLRAALHPVLVQVGWFWSHRFEALLLSPIHFHREMNPMNPWGPLASGPPPLPVLLKAT